MNDLFSTEDFQLASALHFFGYMVEEIDKTNPGRAIFTFKRDELLDGLVQAFWKGQTKVEPIAYSNAQKSLKSRLYNS